MNDQLVNKNIVLLGEFSPTIFDKHFFIKKGIFKEDEDFKNTVFVPELSIIETDDFFVEIRSNRFTVEIKNPNTQIFNISEVINASKIYAVGFNFKWFVPINGLEDTKELFWFEHNKLNSFFDSDNSAYGYYVSKNFKRSRMKLDIKPIQAKKSVVVVHDCPPLMVFQIPPAGAPT